MINSKNIIPLIAFTFLTVVACNNSKTTTQTDSEQYNGTASVTQGPAKIITRNIYDCDRGRKAPIGNIYCNGW